MSVPKYLKFYQAIPQDPFKLGKWDCFLLAQWVRNYYNKKRLPKGNYRKCVKTQLQTLLKKVEIPKHLDIVCLVNPNEPGNNKQYNIGTYLNFGDLEGILYIADKAKIEKLENLLIDSYYRHE
jgi:hypothetical protein